MSNKLLDACRPLQMPPTAKSVLICMADYADDNGQCWPSIDTITAFTCFGRTAVIGAIRWLESAGAISANRSNGRHTSYRVTPEQFDQSVSRTSTGAGPVRLANGTSTGGGPDQSVSRTAPVREADSNHQEPSRTINKATTKKIPVDLPEWLSVDVWREWAAHRKASKNPMTPKAMELSIAKLADFREQGFSPGLVINTAIERGWRGLYLGTGMSPDLKTATPTTPSGKPSAAADFRGKSYESTPLDQLPPDLRAAALAAIGDG